MSTTKMIEEKRDPLILGDCCISLSHSTTYEPPLYLLPELLPKVKIDSKDVEVWDGVADAIDTDNSYWRVASPLGLKQASKNAGNMEGSTESSTNSLAQMIASNRLSSAGISPAILSKGNFCAESIINEIENHCRMAGFSEEEKSLIMSNHFINILAWTKLREINHPVCRRQDKNEPLSGRKRSRDETSNELKPSPTPWSSEVDNPAMIGRFVSGKEAHFERKVELLENLAELYQKPIISLCSRGQQTDHVVPPGVINLTSPYNELPKLVEFDPMTQLRWSNARLPTSLPLNIIPSGSSRTCIPVKLPQIHVGRQEGVVGSKNGYTRVHIGLGTYTKYPDQLSPHHFTLFCRNSNNNPEIWLVNYGRNGIKVDTKKWVLGEPCKLLIPAVLRITRDLVVEIQNSNDNLVEPFIVVKRETE